MLFAITLIIGILLAKITNSYAFILMSTLLLVLLSIFIIKKNGNMNNIIFVIIGMQILYFIGGMEYLYLDKKIKERYKEYAGEQVTIRGVINSEPEFKDDKITFVILCNEIMMNKGKGVLDSNNSSQTTTGKIRLTISQTDSKIEHLKTEHFGYGKIIEVTGVLNIPVGIRNPGGFDYKNYLAVTGISATMYANESKVIVRNPIGKGIFLKLGNNIRKSFIKVINSSLNPKQAGLLNGMLTGYRGGISEETKAAFSDSGLMHIIAVSGLHVGFIILPFIFLFRKLGIKRVLANILVIIILIFYISITGFQPSVLRAVIMAAMVLISQIIWKEADTLTSISFAGITLLIYNPHMLFSIGFQLSFIATLSIVLLNKNMNKILIMLIKPIYAPISKILICSDSKPIPKPMPKVVQKIVPKTAPENVPAIIAKSRLLTKIHFIYMPKLIFKLQDFFSLEKILKQAIGILSTTLSAQAGILPLSILYFNKISVISVLSNLLIAPFTGIVIILGLIMAIVGQISLFVSRVIGLINNIFISIIIFVSETSAKAPFAILKTGISSILIIIIYYILAWFFLWFKPKNKIIIKKTIYAYALICTILVFLIVRLIPGQLEVVFLDVGAGDSIFIRTQSGKTVLIDGGGEKGKLENEPDIGEKIVIPFLLDSGVTKLDLVVATHGHGDHIQGLYTVLKELKVENVILPDYNEADEFDKFKNICRDRNIKITYCNEGDNITLDKETYIKVLNPPLDSSNMEIGKSSLNNNSLVLKLNYKNVKMLFTGDIEKEAEELLVKSMQKADAEVHVLKVPHHGSATSSTINFIELVKPKVAIMTVGKNNYGHPAEAVLKRYTDIEARVFRTDLNGAVIIRSNGKFIKVKVMLGNEY